MAAVLKEQMSTAVFERHFVVVNAAHGKCEACGEIRPGLAILPASMCWMQICAQCFFDLHSAALPTLAREYARWSRR
jgi:hypothetical protein